MRRWQPFGIRTAFAAVTTVFFIGAAAAQTPSVGTDPATFDVGGVRLGMTPDEAMAALKAFDPASVFTKKYISGPQMPWGTEGSTLDMLSDAARDTSVLEDLVAIKGAPRQVCQPPPSMWCTYSHDQDEDDITVWFSRIPGQQQAIMIRRQKTFNKDPKPSIESLKSGILAKYPEPQPTLEFKRGPYILSWLFDARRQLLSGTAAKHKAIPVAQTADGLPPSVRPGDGITLNAVFLAVNTNAQLAQQLTLSLYDAGALFRSVKESTTAYQALKTRADARQLEHSKDVAPTKF